MSGKASVLSQAGPESMSIGAEVWEGDVLLSREAISEGKLL